MINIRKTDWFMISNWFISDEKKNNLNFTNVYKGHNEKLSKLKIDPRNPRTRVKRPIHYTLNHNCVGNMVTTLVRNVAHVLNLVWTWNFCCKLEIVSVLPRSMKWSRSIDRSSAFFAIEINLLIKPIYRDRDRKGSIKIDLDCGDT